MAVTEILLANFTILSSLVEVGLSLTYPGLLGQPGPPAPRACSYDNLMRIRGQCPPQSWEQFLSLEQGEIASWPVYEIRQFARPGYNLGLE